MLQGRKVSAGFALRGITRRTPRFATSRRCGSNSAGNPPAGSGVRRQNKLKLVTHCKNNAGFQQKVLLEYAAYRMYNLLTPFSMRVRLATSIMSTKAAGRLSRGSAFSSRIRRCRGRNNMTEVRAGERIPVTWLNPTEAARYAVYQDIIANHDWSMRAAPQGDECCHNARLIGVARRSGHPRPLRLRLPGSSTRLMHRAHVLDIGSVRAQVRGYCIHGAQALAAARQMPANRARHRRIVANPRGSSPKTRESSAAYLDGYFDRIATTRARPRPQRLYRLTSFFCRARAGPIGRFRLIGQVALHPLAFAIFCHPQRREV